MTSKIFERYRTPRTVALGIPGGLYAECVKAGVLTPPKLMSARDCRVNRLETAGCESVLLATWGHYMTTADLVGRLAFLERQVSTRKAGKIPNLESRIGLAEELLDEHGYNIGQYRHEAAGKSAMLERRIKGLERLVVFVAEVLIALIAVVVAGLAAGCLGGDYWLSK